MTKDIDVLLAKLNKTIGKFSFHEVPLDDKGRSYEDDYYVKCLNCGRRLLLGKCCEQRETQAMRDKQCYTQ